MAVVEAKTQDGRALTTLFTTTAHGTVPGLSRELAYELGRLEIQSYGAVTSGQSAKTTAKTL